MKRKDKIEAAKTILAVADRLEKGGKVSARDDDPIQLGKDLVEKKLDHPAMKVLSKTLEDIEALLTKADKENKGMARMGGANTHLPKYLTEHLLPLVKKMGDQSKVIEQQLKKRLKQKQF